MKLKMIEGWTLIISHTTTRRTTHCQYLAIITHTHSDGFLFFLKT